MGVNFRDSDGTVPKHFLNVPYVDIRLKQAGSESVAEHMWRYMKVNGGEGTILLSIRLMDWSESWVPLGLEKNIRSY